MKYRGRLPRDKRLTTCKQCPLGVYEGTEYVWQNKPVPGFVHAACVIDSAP